MNPTTNYDVYFARGHGVDRNIGNIKYRELVAEFGQAYRNSSNLDKKEITNKIISTIQDLGGIFYYHPEGNEGFSWAVLEPKALNRKVRQSLRDSKPRAVSPTRTHSSLSYSGYEEETEIVDMTEEMDCDQSYYANEEEKGKITSCPPIACSTAIAYQHTDYVMTVADDEQAIEERSVINNQEPARSNDVDSEKDVLDNCLVRLDASHSHDTHCPQNDKASVGANCYQDSVNLEEIMQASINTLNASMMDISTVLDIDPCHIFNWFDE